MITLGFEDPFLEPQKTYILQGQLAPSAGRQGVWKLGRLRDMSMRLQNNMKKRKETSCQFEMKMKQNPNQTQNKHREMRIKTVTGLALRIAPGWKPDSRMN